MPKRSRNLQKQEQIEDSSNKIQAEGSKISKRTKKSGSTKIERPEALLTESPANTSKNYWLMKAEPESRLVNGQDVKFSIDDLKSLKVSCWDGVRNYGARNNMRAMEVGDLAFFYHSNCKPPGIVGVMKICKKAYPDYTAVDKSHPYFDPKSDISNPKWFMVDVEYIKHLPRMITLEELKKHKDGSLKELSLLKQGRLSVSKVQESEWVFINKLALQESTNEQEVKK